MGKQIGIVELVTEIGNDSIKFQPLDSCFIKMDYDHKKGSTISFGTEERITLDGTENMGVILWLPRDRVKEILGKIPASETRSEEE